MGRQATTGQAVLFNEAELMLPAQTKLIEVLQNSLGDDAEVWPDIIQSEGNGQAVMVKDAGSVWIKSAGVKQRSKRMFDVICRAATSDSAERLIDRITIIIRKSPRLKLVDMTEIEGGYDEDQKAFVRGVQVTLRAKR